MNQIFLFSFVTFSSFCCISQCAESLAKAKPIPGKPDYCKVDASFNPEISELKVDTISQMKDACGQISCLKFGNDLTVQALTCGISEFPPECKVTSDFFLPYPECCPTCG